jgi:hypothetical protein
LIMDSGVNLSTYMAVQEVRRGIGESCSQGTNKSLKLGPNDKGRYHFFSALRIDSLIHSLHCSPTIAWIESIFPGYIVSPMAQSIRKDARPNFEGKVFVSRPTQSLQQYSYIRKHAYRQKQ